MLHLPDLPDFLFPHAPVQNEMHACRIPRGIYLIHQAKKKGKQNSMLENQIESNQTKNNKTPIAEFIHPDSFLLLSGKRKISPAYYLLHCCTAASGRSNAGRFI